MPPANGTNHPQDPKKLAHHKQSIRLDLVIGSLGIIGYITWVAVQPSAVVGALAIATIAGALVFLAASFLVLLPTVSSSKLALAARWFFYICLFLPWSIMWSSGTWPFWGHQEGWALFLYFGTGFYYFIRGIPGIGAGLIDLVSQLFS